MTSELRKTVRYIELMNMEKEDVVFLLLAAEEKLKDYSDTERIKLVESLRARNHTYEEIVVLLRRQDEGLPITSKDVPCWNCNGSGSGLAMNDYERDICCTCMGSGNAWQFEVNYVEK